MLYNFIKLHPDARMVKGTTFLVSGITGTVDGTEMIKVKIIHEKELEKIITDLCEVKSVHVYSIQKSPIVNIGLIQQIIKGNSLDERLKSIPNLSIVNKRAIVGNDVESVLHQSEVSGDSQGSRMKLDVAIKRSYQASIKDFGSHICHPRKIRISSGQVDAVDFVCVESGENSKTSPFSKRDHLKDDYGNPERSKFNVIPSCVSESPPSSLLIDKYRPRTLNSIIGQQGEKSIMSKLKKWLEDWDMNHMKRSTEKHCLKTVSGKKENDNGALFNCTLLSGPPGVGKTTTAYLVARELGFDLVEMNASVNRNKKMVGESVSDTLNTTSVAFMMGKGNANHNVTRKRVLLMDEVDGMAGNEDRGGIAELINLIKRSKVPIICICNDRNHQKIRSLVNYCYDLRFSRPRVDQINAAMMAVCFKEKIQIKPDALSELIIGCGQDVRQVLHHLSMVKAAGGGGGGGKMEAEQARREAEMSKKTSVKMGPWDVCKKVFNKEDHKAMSFDDKSDLFFYDYNLAGLFIQENYLQAKPTVAGADKKKLMELVSKAADSMAQGDLVETEVRRSMNWGLLPTAAVFCSVLPGEYMSG